MKKDRPLPEHIQATIETYDQIAPAYDKTEVIEIRRHVEESARFFHSCLRGKDVLVPGCGEGRDARLLSKLGLEVESFDLSTKMIEIAQRKDSVGRYFQCDLRNMGKLSKRYCGVFANGCMYHITKVEFKNWMADCHRVLEDQGVLYLTLKPGEGEEVLTTPKPDYPGGVKAIEALQGPRFYAYYSREELEQYFDNFELIKEQRIPKAQNAFEFFLRKLG